MAYDSDRGRIVYFGGQGIGTHVAVIATWAVIGTVVAVLASRFHYHRALAVEYPSAAPGGQQSESEHDAVRA